MIQPKHHDKTIQVMTCCCFPRGPVRCECWMDKNAYMSGETSQIHVAVQNDSAVNVNHFNTKLIREITLHDGKGSTDVRRDIIAMNKYDGTLAHTSKNSDIPIQLMCKKSKPLKPSSASKMVQCKYTIMIEMDIPWAPDLEIFSDVTIYACQSAPWMAWTAPTWIAQAQMQQISCAQLAVPQQILDTRVHGGVFSAPPNDINVTTTTTTTTTSDNTIAVVV